MLGIRGKKAVFTSKNERCSTGNIAAATVSKCDTFVDPDYSKVAVQWLFVNLFIQKVFMIKFTIYWNIISQLYS